ncbi:MAG: lysophospholipid acyltransferase family protein [Planctomycetota bacterium]
MSLLNNRVSAGVIHGLFRLTSRCRFIGLERLPPRGMPCVLAAAHLSHYDPVVIGALLRREIDWLARDEFYRTAGSRWACEHASCIRIDRYGSAMRGVRDARRRLESHRVVGVFPDGEIRRGGESVLNGAALRGGAALLARRAGVPIVPVVALNADQFRRVGPWLPTRVGRLWIGVGEPIFPEQMGTDATWRSQRAALSARLGEAMREVYRELDEAFGLPDGVRP